MNLEFIINMSNETREKLYKKLLKDSNYKLVIDLDNLPKLMRHLK